MQNVSMLCQQNAQVIDGVRSHYRWPNSYLEYASVCIYRREMSPRRVIRNCVRCAWTLPYSPAVAHSTAGVNLQRVDMWDNIVNGDMFKKSA